MGPADLPRFAISATRDGCYQGAFDASPWVGDGWIAGLYLGGGQFLWGRFRNVDAVASTCSFCPDEEGRPPAVRVGESYPFMDGYWGERAELVLDEGCHWQRVVFQPSDMDLGPVEGGGQMGTRLPTEAPARGDVVPGGWDHEHCAICWDKIGNGGQPEGFFSPPDSWVCEACHGNFVVPRSLAFVAVI